MKKYIALLLVMVFLFSFSACADNKEKENTEPMWIEVMVEWTDFVKINGVIYDGDFRETQVPADKIGEKIGTVSCTPPKVYHDGNGNVTSMEPDEGAASLCRIGTELFAIIDRDNAIAALVDGQYYLYD